MVRLFEFYFFVQRILLCEAVKMTLRKHQEVAKRPKLLYRRHGKREWREGEGEGEGERGGGREGEREGGERGRERGGKTGF